MQNWEKIHYDQQYARHVAKLPGPLINGSFKQHFLAQFLANAFDRSSWVFRIDYRFTGMDLVGETLQVRGRISTVTESERYTVVSTDVEVCNLHQEKVTTTGRGVVLLARDASPMFEIDAASVPSAFRMAREVVPTSDGVTSSVREKLGEVLEQLSSDYELDPSRLRLFCDAVMDMRAWHFDADAARARGYAGIVAPPLFPMHGIELKPGKARLSSDPLESGREGSPSIIGRHLAEQLGVSDQGLLNGGSEVEIESLARPGERIQVESRLLSANVKPLKAGGQMLVVQRLNTYREAHGRVLLVHKPTTLFRTSIR